MTEHSEYKREYRYKRLAKNIEEKILTGIYKPGEKLPSIRNLHKQLSLSITTVNKAFEELEKSGIIESRPKSGYYVTPVTLNSLIPPDMKFFKAHPSKVELNEMVNTVAQAINTPELIPFASSSIDTSLLPCKDFSKILKKMPYRDIRSLIPYSLSEGDIGLRHKIVQRSPELPGYIKPEDIFITNGCTEAVTLAILAATNPGDTIAIEGPTHFGFLQLLRELDRLIIEIPVNPETGIDIDALEAAVKKDNIRACILIPGFHNPTGALMPAGNKEKIIEIAEQRGLTIIEDDIGAELYFGDRKPIPLKAYDKNNIVIYCSSFSKTLAPGLRVGWIIPNRIHKDKIRRIKAGTSVHTSALSQQVTFEYLKGGSYERHLRALRESLKKQVLRTAAAVQKYFPESIRLSVPRGGSLLWIELEDKIDSIEVYKKALDEKIAILPGSVCSTTGYFNNYIRIGCGSPFSEKSENGIRIIGQVIQELESRR